MKRTQTKPVAIKSTVKNHSHLARLNKRASAKPPIPRMPLAPHLSGHPQSKQAQLIALLSSSSGTSMTHTGSREVSCYTTVAMHARCNLL